MEGSKIVSSAILGMDVEAVVINNKPYYIKPPTIRKLAGAGMYLADVAKGSTIRDVLLSLTNDNAAHALSWLINGDDSLFEELKEATIEEITDGIGVAVDLIKTGNFMRLSVLTRSIANLIARPKS